MLARLDPALLGRLSFPLGGMTKPAVRALARDAGLPVADRRESQDLCFLSGIGGRAFLRRGGPAFGRAGEIVDREGRVLGATKAITPTRSASGAGWASPRPSRSMCSPRRPAAAGSSSARAKRWRASASYSRMPGSTAARRRSRRSGLRYRSAAIACRAVERGAGRLELELERPATVAPGSLPA